MRMSSKPVINMTEMQNQLLHKKYAEINKEYGFVSISIKIAYSLIYKEKSLAAPTHKTHNKAGQPNFLKPTERRLNCILTSTCHPISIRNVSLPHQSRKQCIQFSRSLYYHLRTNGSNKSSITTQKKGSSLPFSIESSPKYSLVLFSKAKLTDWQSLSRPRNGDSFIR